MNVMELLANVFFGKSRLSRLALIFGMLVAVSVISITTIFGEINKKDITKKQLEIEKDRVLQIDKQIAVLYSKAYQFSDSLSQNQLLKKIEFLKSQRIEAIRSIDEVNKAPSLQVMIFTGLVVLLTIFVLLFFANSFRTGIAAKETTDISSTERKNIIAKRNLDFLQWVTASELARDNLSNIEIEKARKLKEIYDLSEKVGDDRNKLLSLVISYTNNQRRQNEVQSDKHSEIFDVFENVHDRLNEECTRLNKHALINLFVCFFIAFVLMGFIAYNSIFNDDQIIASNFQLFIIKFLPRIVALLSLLTMFFYFVKLYKTNILDVKYYQNELTNSEHKLASLQTALTGNDSNLIGKIVTDLSAVERNGLISKDQTTSEIERLKLENQFNKDYLERIWSLLSLKRDGD